MAEMAAIVPPKWSRYALEIYMKREPPVLGTLDWLKLEGKAREKLKDYPEAFNYTFGSAGTKSTEDANLAAFKDWKIVPRMLVDSTQRSLETTLFGVKYPSPLLLAPIGVQGIVHPEGELATARGAAKAEVPLIMSTASTRAMEPVAKENGDGKRWYQLYWPRTDDITLSLLSRAKANGFTALVVTLDTMLLGWRPHDLDTSYLPFGHGVGVQVATSDPVFMQRNGIPVRPDERPEFPYDPVKADKALRSGDQTQMINTKLGTGWLSEGNSGMFRTWDDVKFLRDNWDGPLILKGIQRVTDAEKALSVGVDGVVVSNHGGRQVDGAIPSLYALDKICKSDVIREAQRDGRFTILFDSGIRTGSDILKAIALGAQGVLLGRPYMYGLACGGAEGVEQVCRGILADAEITLGLAGYSRLDEIWGKRDEFMTQINWNGKD